MGKAKVSLLAAPTKGAYTAELPLGDISVRVSDGQMADMAATLLRSTTAGAGLAGGSLPPAARVEEFLPPGLSWPSEYGLGEFLSNWQNDPLIP